VVVFLHLVSFASTVISNEYANVHIGFSSYPDLTALATASTDTDTDVDCYRSTAGLLNTTNEQNNHSEIRSESCIDISPCIPPNSLIVFTKNMSYVPLDSSSSCAPSKQDAEFSTTFKQLLLSRKSIKLAAYYFLLYLFTVIYNVSVKRVLTVLPLPTTMTAVQLLLGIPLFLPLWVAKYPKNIESIPRVPLILVSLAHAIGSLATTAALSAGSVSFVHVIKSAEPIFQAVLSAVILKSFFSFSVYLTLIPIMLGVALASVTELSFTWVGFIVAMLSNLFYQLRIVLSKKLIMKMDVDGAGKITAANLFRVVTIVSAAMMLPVTLLLEGSSLLELRSLVSEKPSMGVRELMLDVVVAGLSFYAFNEVSFWILDLVHPITHAIGNTIKRVVLIVVSVIIFRTPMTAQSAWGSLIAVLGSFLYAWVTSH